jgi:nitrosocyanin
MKQVLIGILILAVIGVGLAFATSNRSAEQNRSGSQTPTNATAPQPSAAPTEEIKIVNVEAGSFYYKPNEITVKQGEKVRIVMNSVSMMHDFNIDELGVKMPIIQNGNTGTVEFTADKKGSFEYYCSVGQHRANGQVGTLIVQ